jgi:hypothetical protein
MMKQRRPRRSNKVYWPRELDQKIADYNGSNDPDEREEIFREYLDYPLDKMAENIINKFKFPYIDGDFDDVKKKVISFLVINLSKYTPNKGKSFSYFSVIAKNYLIFHNNAAYKQEKRSVYLSDIQGENNTSLEEIADLQISTPEEPEDFREFVKLMVSYWDGNITRVFKKKRDIDIANAVIELFRQPERIENFNKKALFIMIREMTNCKTSYITKVINKMKLEVLKQLEEFRSEGRIVDKENKFFSYTSKP